MAMPKLNAPTAHSVLLDTLPIAIAFANKKGMAIKANNIPMPCVMELAISSFGNGGLVFMFIDIQM